MRKYANPLLTRGSNPESRHNDFKVKAGTAVIVSKKLVMYSCAIIFQVPRTSRKVLGNMDHLT